MALTTYYTQPNGSSVIPVQSSPLLTLATPNVVAFSEVMVNQANGSTVGVGTVSVLVTN